MYEDVLTRGALRLLQLVAVLLGSMPVAALENPDQVPPPRRIIAPASDLLVHSALAACPIAVAFAADMPERLRVATWNIRAARSASPQDIAAELRAMEADIIALQEVDRGVRRSGFFDQPLTLAMALDFHYAFAGSIKFDGGDYGLALLSRWPLADVRRHRIDSEVPGELRIVLEATVCAHSRPLRVFNHHADVRAAAREVGFATLGELVRPSVGRGVLILGDFNEDPDGPGVRALIGAGLADIGAETNVKTADDGRIDYILVDKPLFSRMSGTQVWPSRMSDHYALLTDLKW